MHEGRVQVDLHLLTLFLQLAGGEDHVRDPTRTTEVALAFRQETLFQMMVQAVEEKASVDLSGNVQQGDASMVVTELAITFPPIEMDGCGVLEILRDFYLTLHLLEERCQMIHELGGTVFFDLSSDRVRFGRFTAGELLHSRDGFVERGWEVEVSVGLHLRQTRDGGVVDGGRTVEDGSELFDSSL
ncbi:hypothetical protein SprV_0200676700 [Sparganum proliferum]